VHYDIVSTTLGPMLVAVSERGVCRVAFGDGEQQLISELDALYQGAARLRDHTRLAQVATEIERRITGDEDSTLTDPLDLTGTPFQRRVWAELCRIPRGQRRSYQEVAARIGQSSAARAVAGACASNRIAVLIPCHRVVREDGALGGYRWGVNRKQLLLAAERTTETSSPSGT
jgi:AraC family transcriptional regulator of adaptative response/methylated-DNA-[protein]-cysteine methyltransferase